MERVGLTLCISFEELVSGGITTPSGIKNLIHRGQVRRVRRACKDTPALYDVESFPQRYKVKIYERFPDAQEREQSKPFVDEIEKNAQAEHYYKQYTFDDGRHLPETKQGEYTANCSVLDAFRRKIEIADGRRISQAQPKLPRGEFWERAALALPRISDKWAHRLPSNPRSLQRKYNEYQRDGFIVMISGKFRNNSAAKIDSDEKEDILLAILAHHNNIDDTKVAKEYNQQARKLGWQEITAGTVSYWRKKNQQAADYGNLGETKYNLWNTQTINRRKPSVPFLYWSVDGWTVELLYQSEREGRDGRKEIIYHKRMTMVVVLDPSCMYPIGIAIGNHESKDLIREALRDALKHGEELAGEMLRVHQIQCDHYALDVKLKGELATTYKTAGEHLTPARVRNARGKIVEQYFNRLRQEYCQICMNYAGKGVTSDPKHQPNADAMNALRKYYPTEREVVRQIRTMMLEERRSKQEQFHLLLDKLPAKDRLKMDKELFLLEFGETSKFTNRLTHDGFKPTLLGIKRNYDTMDVRFRDYKMWDWTTKYDPDDMSQVLVVSAEGDCRFLLDEKPQVAMALYDQEEGEAAHRARVDAYNKELREKAKRRLEKAHDTVARLLDPERDLHGLLSHTCLLNSRGKHKDQRSQEQELLGVEEVEFEEVTEEPTARKKRARWSNF